MLIYQRVSWDITGLYDVEWLKTGSLRDYNGMEDIYDEWFSEVESQINCVIEAWNLRDLFAAQKTWDLSNKNGDYMGL